MNTQPQPQPQTIEAAPLRNYENDEFIFNKRDWMMRSFMLNDRADRMLHFDSGMHVVKDESGRAMASWDEVGQFGCVSRDTLVCPVNTELDDQLIEAELALV